MAERGTVSEIAGRLANPVRTLSFEDLAAAWFMARIAVRIEGMAALAHNLDLLRRVRGGIGRVLMGSASPRGGHRTSLPLGSAMRARRAVP